jgi:hypothetical protein
MHVHTAGCGNPILLAVERDTPCMSILLAVEMDTPCTSILLMLMVGGERDTHAVHVQTAGSEKFKSDTPCTSIDCC